MGEAVSLLAAAAAAAEVAGSSRGSGRSHLLHKLFEDALLEALASDTKPSAGRGPPCVPLDFGKYLLKHGSEKVPTADALRSKLSLGLYFADAKSGQSACFTAELARFYSRYKALDPTFEIVFVSVDRDQDAALQHFNNGHGDWLMVPFSGDIESQLKRGFGIEAVPTLVICGMNGTMIWRNAVEVVRDLSPQEVHCEGAFRPLTIGMQLEDRSDGQSLGRLVALDEDADPIIQTARGKHLQVRRRGIRPAGTGGAARPRVGTFAVGEYVRVKPGVVTPRHEWGSVKPGDIGVIAHRSGASDSMLVDFPERAGWHAVVGEMETVQLQIGMDVKLSYKGLKDIRMLVFLPRGSTARVVGFDGDGDPRLDSGGDRKHVSRGFIVPVGVPIFAVGSHVGAFGLGPGDVELNGRSGTVVKEEGECVHVDFGAGLCKALKPHNLAQRFPVGGLVEICDLASAPALNGEAAKVLRLEGGQYVVEVVTQWEEKTVSAENLRVKHRSVMCYGCNAVEFAGVRHKCAICPDYDLCPTCHDRRHEVHPGHTFGAIPAPLVPDQLLEVLAQARQAAAAPTLAAPTSPAKSTPPEAMSANSSWESNLEPQARPTGGKAPSKPAGASQGAAGNANASAGEDTDREALQAWLREKAKVDPEHMDEVLKRCDERQIWTVAHAEMMQEDGSLQEILPEQTLEDWLSTVANVDPRSVQWAVEACNAKNVFKVDDILGLSKEQLKDVFGSSVVRLQVAKAIGHPSGGFSSHVSGGAGTAHFSGKGSKYKRVKDLGEGSYGITYLAEKGGKLYAIKRSKGMTERDADSMFREGMLMSAVKHERLVHIEDFFIERDAKSIRLHLVLEYCSGGDLRSRLWQPNKPMEDESSHFVACVAEGLAYMHEQKPAMLHRDVKPANILLCPGPPGGLPNVKLGDFGLARRDTGSTQNVAGSRLYMSPDAWEAASPASDVWALGRVAADLATGELAKQQIITRSQVDDLLARIPKAELSETFFATIRDMLEIEPSARLTASDVARNLRGIGDGLAGVASSSTNFTAILHGLAWMKPSGVRDLQWERVAHDVRQCTFSPASCTDPEGTAQRHLLDLINLTPSNKGFTERYANQITRTVLCKSTSRAVGFLSTCYKINHRRFDRERSSLESEMGDPSTAKGQWRRRILERLEERYPSVYMEASVSNVRIRTAFHATRDMNTALGILNGGFASLNVTEPGVIGNGIYVTLDAEYALQKYGPRAPCPPCARPQSSTRGWFGRPATSATGGRVFCRSRRRSAAAHGGVAGGGPDGAAVDVPLVVCVVVCGNAYPVIENHVLQPKDSLFGKALVPKADAHVSVMARDPAANRGYGELLPCPPDEWDKLELFTEMVLPEAQVLPLGILLVRQR